MVYFQIKRAQYSRDMEEQQQAAAYFEKALLNKNQTYIIAEYATFLIDLGQLEKAIDIYEIGINNLKKLKEFDDKQTWWLKSFQNELDYLTNN